MAQPAAMSSGTPEMIDSTTSSGPVCRLGPTTLTKRNPRMAMGRKRAADVPRRIDGLFGVSFTCGVHLRSPSASSTVQAVWTLLRGYSSKQSMLSEIEGRSMGIGSAHRASASRLPTGTHQTGFVGEDDEG